MFDMEANEQRVTRCREQAEDLVATLRGRAACAPRTALDPVSASAIRTWCEAMGERAWAATSNELLRIAPPATLQLWTFPPLAPERALDGPSLPGDLDTELRRHLAELGYPATLATAFEYEFARPIEVGTTITATQHYLGSSAEKETAIGRGFFVTSEAEYVSQDDTIIGRVRSTVFQFEAASSTTLGEPRQMLLPGQRTGHGSPGEVALDARFETVEVPLTTTQIVAGALATRDLYPVHHDRDFARAHGSRDMLMSIPTTCGLLARIVGEWTSAARLVTLKVRLRAPAYANSILSVEGHVSRLEDGIAEVKMTACTEDGVHAEAVAQVDAEVDADRARGRSR